LDGSVFAAQPQAELQAMYFNTPHSELTYLRHFHGVLRGWVASADREGIKDTRALTQFLSTQLDAYFAQCHHLLERIYPGLTDQSYRLLMAMNLAHGFYDFGTVPGWGHPLRQALHLRYGDCDEIADLLLILARAQGIRAHELGFHFDAPSPIGQLNSNHVVVYADGLWLDSEINTAIQVDFGQLRHVAPADRLPTLLNHHHVFGFYDWYLQPQVRQEQLNRGVDGGIIAFFYQYYFAAIGQGSTLMYTARR
jgi:hypothetical protein